MSFVLEHATVLAYPVLRWLVCRPGVHTIRTCTPPRKPNHIAYCSAPITDRKNLVELAVKNEEKAAYLDKMSPGLVGMVDLGLVVRDALLPAHSFVVAALCPPLAERLSDKRIEHSDCDSRPLLLDLPADDVTCVQAALLFMYSLCPYQGEDPEIQSQDEAEQLATFAQKYEVTLMSKASDDYLQEFLTDRYNVPNYAPSYSSRPTQEAVKNQLPDILKWAMWQTHRICPGPRSSAKSGLRTTLRSILMPTSICAF